MSIVKTLALKLFDGILAGLVATGFAAREEMRGSQRLVDGRPLLHKQVRRHQDILASLSRLGFDPATAALLEVGCGPGWFLDALRVKGWKTLQACDWLPEDRVDEQVRNAASYRRVDLNTEGLSVYADNSFAVVVSSNVIEHLENPAAVLREIGRVLVDDGIAVISIPNAFNLFERLAILLTGNSTTYRLEPSVDTFGHISMLPSRVIHSLARRAGMELLRVDPGFVYLRGAFLLPERKCGPFWSHNVTYVFKKTVRR